MTKVDKNWKVLSGESKKEILGLPKWLISILENRGIKNEQEISSFLDPKYEQLLDPMVFAGMSEVTERIYKAVLNKEKIVIYGDYDVDGITSTALINDLLSKIGINKFETYIPHREEEGYGLNEEAIQEIIKNGSKIIIAVDCGITSKDLIDKYYSKIDFIIIDHHEISKDKLTKNALILHPRLTISIKDQQNLSACGMAFFLAKNVFNDNRFNLISGHEKWLLDLVALSTICDIVPLVGQNRILAKYGILVLSKTKRVGIQALANVSSFKISEVGSYEIGFLLGPRLNASGRLAHAKKSLELILTESKSEAIKIASELNKINTERQQLTEKILNEAKAEIESGDKKDHEIFLLSNKNWPRGVVGIIASKISDIYTRPTIIFENDGDVHHGSARSIEALDITESLSECEDCLIKFGGHAKAAGLSVSKEKWILFNDKLLEIVKGKIKKEDLVPIVKIDTKINISDINDDTVETIEKLEPFGYGNSNPTFMLEKVKVSGVKRVGGAKEHLKFMIDNFSAISFFDPTPISDDDIIDIAFNLRYNIWNERKSIELRIVDIKLL